MEVMDQDYLSNKPMNVGDWVITILLTALPIIGIILLFVWAFGDNQKIDRANYSKASLIWIAVWLVFGFIFLIFFGGLAMLSQM
jgi:succinate dehydrogenase/fumarate reductase cytochrome b subunit